MRIYLIFDHEENGPEDVLADVDPVRFRARALAWLALGYLDRGMLGRGLYTRESVTAALDAAIAAEGRNVPLTPGWGGPNVRVVDVPDWPAVRRPTT